MSVLTEYWVYIYSLCIGSIFTVGVLGLYLKLVYWVCIFSKCTSIWSLFTVIEIGL